MKCEKCKGLGCFEPPACRGFVKCPDCKGTGDTEGKPRPEDAGLGEALEIHHIPAGTEDAEGSR